MQSEAPPQIKTRELGKRILVDALIKAVNILLGYTMLQLFYGIRSCYKYVLFIVINVNTVKFKV